MTSRTPREIERAKTNRLLEELYGLKQSEIENMSPQEMIALDSLIALKKIEKYLEHIVGFEYDD